MHNSLKRAVSIAIAAIALFSLPCGSILQGRILILIRNAL